MRYRLTSLLLVALVLLLAALLAQPYVERHLLAASEPRTIAPRGDLAEFEKTAIHIFETAAPSVVQVVARSSQATESGQVATQSGTGFVWDAAGHVVTNNHVVNGGVAIAIRLPSGETVPADVVGVAPTYDLAVLRLGRKADVPPPLAIGQSANLKVGQAAFAIGNPFGLEQSLSAGIVSALKRRLPTSGGREIADVIQTDAPINPGNSGGPLIDSAGRLIGVNTAIFSPSGANAGIGFAIPVDIVNKVVPELIRSGHVPTPGIGILAADEAIAARLGATGVIVEGVVPGSPAARVGLKGVDQQTGSLGDVIVAASGAPVRRLADLTDKLEETGVGGTVSLTLLRNGDRRTVQVPVVDVTHQG
jgi:2-alkenal reductase